MNNDTHQKLTEEMEEIIQRMIKNFNEFIDCLENHMPDTKKIKTGNVMTYSSKIIDRMNSLQKSQKKLYIKFEIELKNLWKREIENVD